MGNEDAAPFSTYDIEEAQSVTILEYLLDEEKLKSQINVRDTYPNIDGFIELVDDEQSPIGRITIQVKKLPDSYAESPKKTFPVKTLNYAKKISEPFILIVVDTENEIAYWKHISASWVRKQNLGEQVHKTICFSPDKSINGIEEDYIGQWRAITSQYRKNRTRHSIEYKPSSEIKVEQLALEDEAVGELVGLLDQGGSWVNLYRIYEFIQNNLESNDNIVDQGWWSASEKNLFKHTANSREALGDEARHGSKIPAPDEPMTHAEAKRLVETLIDHWLRHRKRISNSSQDQN